MSADHIFNGGELVRDREGNYWDILAVSLINRSVLARGVNEKRTISLSQDEAQAHFTLCGGPA